MLLSYSNIPNEFLKPLNIETGIEYTIDSDKFPGIEEENGEPTLVLAQTQETCVNTTQPSNVTSNAEDFLPQFTNFKVPADVPQVRNQKVPGHFDQGSFVDEFCQSSVQRRLTFETPTNEDNQRHYSPDKGPPSLVDNTNSLLPEPLSFLSSCQSSQVLSCLDPFDDSFSTTRNDGTSSAFTTPSANHSVPSSTPQHEGHWPASEHAASQIVLPNHSHYDLVQRGKVPVRRVQGAHVSVYAVEGSANIGQDLFLPPQQRTTGFQVKSLPEKRPLPEDSPEEAFDEYSCPPKRPSLPRPPSKRRHTIHYRGEKSVVRKPPVSHKPIIRPKEPNLPPPNVDISKLLLRPSSTNSHPGNRIIAPCPTLNRSISSFHEARRQNPTCSTVNMHLPLNVQDARGQNQTTCSTMNILPSMQGARGQNSATCSIMNLQASIQDTRQNPTTCSTVNLPPSIHDTRENPTACSPMNLPPSTHDTRQNPTACSTMNLPPRIHDTRGQNPNQASNPCINYVQSSNQSNNNCLSSQQTDRLPANPCVTNDSFLDILRAHWSSPLE